MALHFFQSGCENWKLSEFWCKKGFEYFFFKNSNRRLRCPEKMDMSHVSSKKAADAFGVLKNGCESCFLKNICGRLRRPRKVAVRCLSSKSGCGEIPLSPRDIPPLSAVSPSKIDKTVAEPIRKLVLMMHITVSSSCFWNNFLFLFFFLFIYTSGTTSPKS